ncbi:MAG: hypothetical protein QUT30_16140 [Acidobacteriota bacterium]|nr:hypothetical protein [Acidobacteriota bacterium]
MTQPQLEVGPYAAFFATLIDRLTHLGYRGALTIGFDYNSVVGARLTQTDADGKRNVLEVPMHDLDSIIVGKNGALVMK